MAKYLGIPLQVASGTTVTPTYGSPEFIVDGDFPAATTAWQFLEGATLETNGAKIDNIAAGENARINQAISNNPSGRRFVFTYDVVATNGAVLQIEQLSTISLNTTTTGTNRKVVFTWDKVDNFLSINRVGAGTNVTIDNVSLKEVSYALSEEQVKDGNFPQGTSAWTIPAGWSVANNKLNGSSATETTTQEVFASAISRNLKITFDVVVVSGKVKVKMSDNTQSFITTSGSYTQFVTSSSKTIQIDGQDSDAFTGSVTNVSVKELEYNYLQVVSGDLLKESKVGDVVFNSSDDNEAVVLQVISNDVLLLSNDNLSDVADAFSIFAPNGDTRGNQILRIDNYIISEYDEASSAPSKSSFWFAAGPQADKVTLTQLNEAVNTYFVADVIERFVQRLNAQSATASRLDIPLNEFRDHKYNQVLTTTAITLS